MGLFLLQQRKPGSREHWKVQTTKLLMTVIPHLSAWLHFSPFHISVISSDQACFMSPNEAHFSAWCHSIPGDSHLLWVLCGSFGPSSSLIFLLVPAAERILVS